MIESKFKFGVGNNDATRSREFRSAAIDLESNVAEPRGEFASNLAGGFLEGDILVVTSSSFRGGRENGFGQFVGFAQARRERNAADFARGPIVFPSRAGDVAARDAFDRNRIGAADNHRTAAKIIRVTGKFTGEIRRADDVVRDDAREFFEPEKRKLREDAALVGNRRGKNYVEGRKTVRRNNEQLAAEIVNVADFAAGYKFQP